MSTRRVDRPYVRQRRVHGARGADRSGAAGRLARMAGADGSVARPPVDRLEPRQLLFSLTITPDMVNPATGLGTINQAFGYTIPILQTTIAPGTADPEERVENFDDEPLGGIGSPRVFDGDGLVVLHTIANPGANFRMIADLDGQGTVVQGTERILANPRAGESYRFRFLPDETSGPNGPRIAVNSFSITFNAAVGTNQGITPGSLLVRLRLANQVVAEYTTAAQIQALKLPGTGVNGIGVYTFTTQNPLFSAFDEIEFQTVEGPNPAYEIDNISWVVPAGNFAAIVSSVTGRRSASRAIGASVQVLDIYGRDMIATIRLGKVGDAQVLLVDLDDNGIPNFNDGIGQIRFLDGHPIVVPDVRRDDR